MTTRANHPHALGAGPVGGINGQSAIQLRLYQQEALAAIQAGLDRG